MTRSSLPGLAALLLAGCAALPPPTRAPMDLPQRWSEPAASIASATLQNSPARWWSRLGDAAMDQLVDAAAQDSPSVAQALARVAEAQAALQGQGGDATPHLSGALGVGRGNSDATPPRLATRAGPSLMLSWEIDLWGRAAQGRAAAQHRLQARNAELELASLLLQAQVLDTVLADRACRLQLALGQADLASLRGTAALLERRVAVGASAGNQLARAQANLAQAQGALAANQAQCRQLRHALVALTGLALTELESIAASVPQSLPPPPTTHLALPAIAVLQHPQMRAALAAADAAHYELGAARASRLPSLSLTALLSHQWIRALGNTSEENIWSIGSSLAAPLLDGGAGAARVDSASARLDLAMAALEQALRATVQDIESALARMGGARQRHLAAQQGDAAVETSLRATQASFDVGRVSLLELEEARRFRRRSQVELLNAQREETQAWGALIKSAGNAADFTNPAP